MVSRPSSFVALTFTPDCRECSGADGTSVNLMVIVGGTGKVEDFLVDSELVRADVYCRDNGTTRDTTSG